MSRFISRTWRSPAPVRRLRCRVGALHPRISAGSIARRMPSIHRVDRAILPTRCYGELFGLDVRDGERRSHFRYFHGRSSLSTWLRAVLSQRHVDRLRSTRRQDPLPEVSAEARSCGPLRRPWSVPAAKQLRQPDASRHHGRGGCARRRGTDFACLLLCPGSDAGADWPALERFHEATASRHSEDRARRDIPPRSNANSRA